MLNFRSHIMVGDVLKVLPDLPRELKFDIVIADPPYNIGKDFGNNQNLMPLYDYIQWTRGWLKECEDLLSDSGLIYIYGFPEILAHVAVEYSPDSQRWLQWHYTNKTVPGSTFWQRSHESILCLWKQGQERPRLEIDQIREPYSVTLSEFRRQGTCRDAFPLRFKWQTHNLQCPCQWCSSSRRPENTCSGRGGRPFGALVYVSHLQ